MINDGFNITGRLQIELNGKVVRDIDNLVTTAGKAFVAASMLKTTSNSPAAMTHMALGTDTTNPAVADTTLGTELSGRVSLTSAAVSNNVVTYIATFAAGVSTGAIVEAGIFNASSGGTLLCHTEFAVVNKGSADAITITWTVTVS
tara:strand:- start:565 stop:1002 length:438 start_codon:yes stop_codon:yes gene_type:complete